MEKLIVAYRNVFFGDGVKDGLHGFDYDDFMELFEILINNINIPFGGNVFKQVAGIPMETNCVPFLAILYLFYPQYTFLHTLASTKNYHGQSFGLTVRFIDDLLCVNYKY